MHAKHANAAGLNELSEIVIGCTTFCPNSGLSKQRASIIDAYSLMSPQNYAAAIWFRIRRDVGRMCGALRHRSVTV
jgi:hypothetical protein